MSNAYASGNVFSEVLNDGVRGSLQRTFTIPVTVQITNSAASATGLQYPLTMPTMPGRPKFQVTAVTWFNGPTNAVATDSATCVSLLNKTTAAVVVAANTSLAVTNYKLAAGLANYTPAPMTLATTNTNRAAGATYAATGGTSTELDTYLAAGDTVYLLAKVKNTASEVLGPGHLQIDGKYIET